MIGSGSFDITAPYSAWEAWFYDRFIAPAVLDLKKERDADFAQMIPPRGHLLEVGCGGGQITADIASRNPGLQITGLDLSWGQVKRVTRRTRGCDGRVRVVRASALDLPFPDETFDGVYSIASIKHWPDQERGMAECVRVLRRGGRLMVLEADRGCKLDDARRFVGRYRVPAVIKGLAVIAFRMGVAGYGPDLDDARALLAGLPLAEAEARRLDGTPALVMLGRKAGARGGDRPKRGRIPADGSE